MFRTFQKTLNLNLPVLQKNLNPYCDKNIIGQRGGGFTLIEFLVALAVLGALAAISVPLYTSQVHKARITKAIAEIKTLELMIHTYEVDHHSLPTSLDDINWGNVPDPWGNPYKFVNFEHELGKKGGAESKGKGGGSSHGGGIAGIARKWHGDVPINARYDLYSMGADGKTVLPIVSGSGRDDIIRANDGLYVGLASNY